MNELGDFYRTMFNLNLLFCFLNIYSFFVAKPRPNDSSRCMFAYSSSSVWNQYVKWISSVYGYSIMTLKLQEDTLESRPLK
jgi:hypothetical protein